MNTSSDAPTPDTSAETSQMHASAAQTPREPNKVLYQHSTGPSAEQIPWVIELQRDLGSLLLGCFVCGLLLGVAVGHRMLFVVVAVGGGLYWGFVWFRRREGVIKNVGKLRIRWRSWEFQAMGATEYVLGVVVGVSSKHVWNRLMVLDVQEWSVWSNFCLLLVILALYHKGEFIMVLQYHPLEVSWNAYLIYHSKQYLAANLVMYLEFFIEVWLANHQKSRFSFWTFLVGGLIAIVGLVIRNTSFHTAKSNFHHLIRHQKETSHTLITSGIYSLERHPAYLGFFLQTIGLQLLIVNPLTTLTHFLVLRKFFADRIAEEEESLRFIFGEKYTAYCARVHTWLPVSQDAS